MPCGSMVEAVGCGGGRPEVVQYCMTFMDGRIGHNFVKTVSLDCRLLLFVIICHLCGVMLAYPALRIVKI